MRPDSQLEKKKIHKLIYFKMGWQGNEVAFFKQVAYLEFNLIYFGPT